MHKWQSQSRTSYFLFHTIYRAHMQKISPDFNTKLLRIFSVQCPSQLRESSSTSEQQLVYLPSKSYLLCLQLLLNGILQWLMLCVMMFLQKGFQRTKQVKTNGARSNLQNGCGNTVHPNFVKASLVCTFVCSLLLSHRSNTSVTSLVGQTQ